MALSQSSGSRPKFAQRVTEALAKAPTGWFVLYAVICAFTTYFCMYSFRKPWAAGSYSGSEIWIFDLKNALVISQLCGYALSKLIGIKFNTARESADDTRGCDR